MRLRTALALAAGAVAGFGVDAAISRAAPGYRTAAAQGGLVSVAAIYPVARRRPTADAAMAREVAGLAVNTTIAALSRGLAPRRARVLLGAAWAAHGLFDLVHTTSGASRLPSWYPAMCAGYDVAFGARLAAVA